MSDTTLFISDLHLDATRPAITALFLDFLDAEAAHAEVLYILGDLFEAWIGDDDHSPEHQRVIAALQALTTRGVTLYLMHGNRDFLIGTEFVAHSGAKLLADPTVIDLYGTPTLVTHGDMLCTDDTAYQQFRALVRDPLWQHDFLAKPLVARRQIAQAARVESTVHTANAAAEIMDVNPQAVSAALRHHHVTQLIHGHTHRPAVHAFDLDGCSARRIVLGDWYEQGSVLRCDAQGCRLQSLPLAAER